MKTRNAAGFTLVAVLFAALPSSFTQDLDAAQLLQSLKTMREQNAQQVKAQKLRALDDVRAAAASPSAAAAAWEEAVRQVQFEGVAKEGAQFREWKEREGAGLDHKDGQNAARLYFSWLALTLQRSAGTPVKDLLPSVVAYTKEASAAVAAVEGLEERIKREREQAQSGRNPGRDRDRRGNDDDQTRRIAEQILRGGLPGSPPVKAMKLDDLLSPREFGGATEGPGPERGQGPGRQPQTNARDWEMSPGNVDGIFQKIILPELRAQKDPRLLEYWDVILRREAEAAQKSRLAYDLEKYNQSRRPELLWARAEDELLLGQRTKAITDMFNVVKAHPGHFNAQSWIARIESLLSPTNAETAPPGPSLPVAPINPPAAGTAPAPAATK